MPEPLHPRAAVRRTRLLNSLCLIYLDAKRFDDALETAQKASEFLEGCPGVGEHEIATSHINLASVHLKRNELDEAADEIDQALTMYDAMPEENVHHAAALQTKAFVQVRQKDFDGAIASLTRAAELTERFYGKNAEYDMAIDALERVRKLAKQEQD